MLLFLLSLFDINSYWHYTEQMNSGEE